MKGKKACRLRHQTQTDDKVELRVIKFNLASLAGCEVSSLIVYSRFFFPLSGTVEILSSGRRWATDTWCHRRRIAALSYFARGKHTSRSSHATRPRNILINERRHTSSG